MNKLKMYPVLSKEFSLSNVITEKGDNMLIYDTTTKIKARPNKSTYEFVKRCRGDKSLEEIIADLSCVSGEPFEKVEESLLPLVETMVKREMLFFASSPLQNPRKEPSHVKLLRRLQGVSLEITRQCNLRCIHCYSDSGLKRQNELTTKEIKKIIDELSNMGVLNILVTGGEPLLHPHVFEIIAYIREKPMSCMLFTNGTLITKEIAQKLKELGILSVTLSLDGVSPETHDALRGKSWEKIVKAIEILKETGIPIRVNAGIHRGILGEVRELLEFFEKKGIEEYYMGPITFSGREENENCTVTPEEYKEALETIKEYDISKGKDVKNLPYFPELITCGIGMGNLTIRSNGDVTPCITFPDSICLGNVRDTTITDIWNDSPLLNELRNMSALKNVTCSTCTHIKVCGGGCIADHYRRTGELGLGDPYECAYFEVYEYVPVAIDEQYLPLEIR